MPDAFVDELALANDPPAPVLVQVTTTPDVVTGLPLASVNCALMVTALPATGDDELLDTTYFVAAPDLRRDRAGGAGDGAGRRRHNVAHA